MSSDKDIILPEISIDSGAIHPINYMKDSIMDTGESITVAHIVKQGSTPYYNSAVTVDGSAITPEWQGGAAPSAGNASSLDVYSYTIIKTGSATFTALASQTQFA